MAGWAGRTVAAGTQNADFRVVQLQAAANLVAEPASLSRRIVGLDAGR